VDVYYVIPFMPRWLPEFPVMVQLLVYYRPTGQMGRVGKRGKAIKASGQVARQVTSGKGGWTLSMLPNFLILLN
jgi:hypothetical protein